MDQNTARSVAFQLLPNQSRSWADLARVVDERVLHQILRQFGVSDPSEVPQGRRAEWDDVLAAAHRTLTPAQTPLDWALAYAAAGWSVLPADPKTREPLMELGVTHATTDPVSIRSWWAACPQAVPALGCKLSGVFAIDLDCKPGKTDGRTTWAGVTQGRTLPGALVATTPSGGRHLIFRAPAGAPVKSPVEFWPGVDFKGGNGSGGYVLLPCGQGDRIWLQGDPRTDPAVEAPEWLVAIIPRRKEKEPEEIEEPARQPAREDLEDDLARAEWVLQHVFPDADALDYGQWLFRLMELASLGGKGVELAKAWNAKGSKGKYNPSVDDARFGGFNGERQVASLFAAADEKSPGWRKAQKSEARTAASAAAFSPLPGGGGSLFDEVATVAPPAPVYWVRRKLHEMLAEPVPPWLIKGYLRTGQVGILGAFSTVGKSTLAAAWLMHIAYGRPWAGRRVRGGSVMVLAGENRRGFANNLEAYARHHGFGELPAGRAVEVVDFRQPLSSSTGQAGIRVLLDQFHGDYGHYPTFLVIDTLSSHWAESEDSSEFGAPALRALEDAAQGTGCTILVVHHTNKGKGKDMEPSLADLRGSSVFYSNVDSTMLMWAPSEGKARLSAPKLKNDASPPVVELVRVSVGCGVDEDGEPISAGVFEQTVDEVAVAADEERERLDEDVALVVRTLGALGAGASKKAVATKSGMRTARGYECFDVAVAQGLVVNTGTARAPRWEVTNEGRTTQVFRPVVRSLLE